jgi:hypothetical protein
MVRHKTAFGALATGRPQTALGVLSSCHTGGQAPLPTSSPRTSEIVLAGRALEGTEPGSATARRTTL